MISDVPSAELELDSSITVNGSFKESGVSKVIKSAILDNAPFKIYEGPASFSVTLNIKGKVPAKLFGKFNYTYGKGDEFYPLTPYSFSVGLEGEWESSVRIKINSFDLKNPVSNCGDEDAGGKSRQEYFY